jgi:hypothetical protein
MWHIVGREEVNTCFIMKREGERPPKDLVVDGRVILKWIRRVISGSDRTVFRKSRLRAWKEHGISKHSLCSEVCSYCCISGVHVQCWRLVALKLCQFQAILTLLSLRRISERLYVCAWVNRPGREGGHWQPSVAGIKNVWIYASTVIYILRACRGVTLYFDECVIRIVRRVCKGGIVEFLRKWAVCYDIY